jgi:hypothetical protein
MSKLKTHGSNIHEVKSETGVHSYSEEETEAFVEFINDNLSNDAQIGNRLPLDKHGLFEAVKDGVMLW